MLTLKVVGPDGAEWGTIHADARTFSTGSVGYGFNGKLTDPKTGKRYQTGLNAVEIGSKPKAQ